MDILERVAGAIIEAEPHPLHEAPADWNHIKTVPGHELYEKGMRQAKAALMALATAPQLPSWTDGGTASYPVDDAERGNFRLMCRTIAAAR